MEGQERYGDGLEKHRKGEMNVGQMTEPERRTETSSAETGVNNSQVCSMRDMDTKLCDCGVKPKAIYSNCQVMRIMELERGLCDSEVGGRVGYAGSNTENHTYNDREKQLERDVARHSAVEGTRSPKSCGKGGLRHCRTHMMGNDPQACKEADKAGDFSGCRMNNTSSHSTFTTASQVVEDSSECMARQPKSGEMEGNLWPVEHEDQDDSLCECSCGESYEQLPDLSRLGISSAMDYMVHYPYEDCSSNEFVMMCDFAAAEETQVWMAGLFSVSIGVYLLNNSTQ